MSTDQICAYCEHSARLHLNGVGVCHHGDGNTTQHLCGCPRFVANVDTETHEVTAQVLAEDATRVAKSIEDYEARVGGTHCPTDILPPPLDLINHPPHYTAHPSGVECIQITEHMNFNIGNAVKYLWRFGLKSSDSLEDLKKARWYVDREIARLSK